MKKRIRTLLCAAVLLLLPAMECAADADVRDSYTYTYWGDAEPLPDLYEAQRVIRAEDSGLLPFKEPQDLFVDARHGNKVYVADTGRNRVVVYDADFTLLGELHELTGSDGAAQTLSAPMGVFVDAQERIYVADQGNKRAVCVDAQGNILAEYRQPEGEITFESVDFLPVNVLADTNGFVYVLGAGMLEGAAVYTQDGVFQGYYGANTVEITLTVALNNFWKKLLNQEQREKIEKNVPDQVANFDIDSRNFIYTCTEISQTNQNQIKRFNPVSVNVLRRSSTLAAAYQEVYGDLKVSYLNGSAQRSSFVDVCCDSEGYIYGLDFTRGRIFMYTESGELIGAYGGAAEREGYFRKCAAIDDMGTRLVVLDSAKNDITVLSRTAFAENIVRAQTAYAAGEYAASLESWQQVLGADRHLELAINGVGRALYNLGDYTAAMNWFREGNDRVDYEKAFQRSRDDRMRTLFPWLLSGLAAAALLAGVCVLVRRRRRTPAAAAYGPRKRAYVRHILSHPTDGFDDLREQKHTLLLFTLFILLLLFTGRVAQRQLTGFLFNTNDFSALNLATEFSRTILVFLLWVICHWAVSTLFSGKAAPREIWTVSAVALTPYVAAVWINVLLSNVLLTTESMFMTILQGACVLWAVWILLSGLIDYQEFSFWQTIGCILLTLAAMLVVVFVLVLLFSLFQQVANFIQTVAREIMLRVQ